MHQGQARGFTLGALTFEELLLVGVTHSRELLGQKLIFP